MSSDYNLGSVAAYMDRTQDQLKTYPVSKSDQVAAHKERR